jgi:hypothetical protein
MQNSEEVFREKPTVLEELREDELRLSERLAALRAAINAIESTDGGERVVEAFRKAYFSGDF